MKHLFLILFAVSSTTVLSQEKINVNIDGFDFESVYDDSNYVSYLTVKKFGRKIFESNEFERITSIQGIDFNDTGSKTVLIESYTGGAHCCIWIYAGQIENNNFVFKDTLYWGNSGFHLTDIDNNGIQEMMGGWDGFSYEFAPYAFTMFPVIVYTFSGNVFKNVTSDFPSVVYESIERHKEALKEFSSYECPVNEEESFSSDAGAVKSILAALVYDYSSINKADEGYDFINNVYRCPDKTDFINKLKNTYNLK